MVSKKRLSGSGSTVQDFERFAQISGMSFSENASTPINYTQGVPSATLTLKNVGLHKLSPVTEGRPPNFGKVIFNS